MHFYDFNIGDYAKKTSHLTNGEDLAYRRALDVYYDTEQPFDLSGGLATLSRRLRVDEKDLKNVIDEFFPDGRNKHADEKIAAYYAFLERQKANGKLGGRPKHKDLKPSANPVVSQNNPVPSQPLPTKPLPTNQINTEPTSGEVEPFTGTYKKAVNIKTFLEDCEKNNVKRIPETDPVFDFAESNKIPMDMIKVCWWKFVRDHSEKKKRYQDWRAAFRNCVRDSWYSFWIIEADGTVKETTKFRAAKNEMASVKENANAE